MKIKLQFTLPFVKNGRICKSARPNISKTTSRWKTQIYQNVTYGATLVTLSHQLKVFWQSYQRYLQEERRNGLIQPFHGNESTQVSTLYNVEASQTRTNLRHLAIDEQNCHCSEMGLEHPMDRIPSCRIPLSNHDVSSRILLVASCAPETRKKKTLATIY